jgi:excisionase family DNA binding protein
MHKSEIVLERLAYSVTDAAAIIGISRHLLYDAIRNGEIMPKRCGARTLITADRLRAYLEGLPDGVEPRSSPNSRARKCA